MQKQLNSARESIANPPVADSSIDRILSTTNSSDRPGSSRRGESIHPRPTWLTSARTREGLLWVKTRASHRTSRRRIRTGRASSTKRGHLNNNSRRSTTRPTFIEAIRRLRLPHPVAKCSASSPRNGRGYSSPLRLSRPSSALSLKGESAAPYEPI